MHNATPEQIEAFLNSGGETRVVIRKIERIAIDPAKQNALLDLQRNHWRKLHTTRFTADQLELWIQSIPGCASCQRDFRRIIADHPPRLDDWERWTWEVHNAVNKKLGKQLIAWTDAITLWDWPIPLRRDRP